MKKTTVFALALVAALVAFAAPKKAKRLSLVELAGKEGVTSQELAEEVRRVAPWKRQLTDEIFNEYVLPDAVIDEAKDDWRPMFTKMFVPVIKGARNPTEAVRKINAVVWEKLDVKYSMERDFPNQSPFHSMRIHKASCTGQTILLVCAYRSVGVPARLVTCNWTSRPGNHSWVEYYDKGWHVCGEDGKSAIDDRWSAILASEADASDPSKHIYASRATPNGTWLWRTWGDPNVPMVGLVPADDVTERYRKYKDLAKKLAKKVKTTTIGRPRIIKTGEVIQASPEPSRRGYYVPKGRSKLLRAL
ncbi:MAG: hypothetical protein K6F50_02900 [Kiritimatiellae bacterium]|nr:hypothetical protein [Kiritimatiellia bacterium]